ncbi:MAG: VCBS repeat-containing protein [Opitutaceae bacterium]|nr:VCBS repeat-containing protein [Opitutaceae bacterium]
MRYFLHIALAVAANALLAAPEMSRLKYNDPGLLVELGVGLWAWPLPMDHDGDGLMDLVVVCTDKPSNGIYVFRNSGKTDPQNHLPIFDPAKRVGPAVGNPQISYVDGRELVTTPNHVYPDFKQRGFQGGVKIPAPQKIHEAPGNIRANQWRYADYDDDGRLDLLVGIGWWGDYGWDNAYDASGTWTKGPLRGYVYLLRNTGTSERPAYASPVKLEAGGRVLDGFGMPSPNLADFDGDGDLDLICGEFRDGFTYYENVGSRAQPRFAEGRRLTNGGRPIAMDLCMITPVAYDFNRDGHMDLIVGDEDGRVAFIEHTGEVKEGMPQFLPPRYARQYADNVKFGALSSPVCIDWDGDGQDDLISGNSAGYIGFIKNLGGNPRRWAAPVYLAADGVAIRIMAGPNGSIQGPAEAKWGYSNVSVADWDGDGLPDVMDLGIWGRIMLYRNIGTRTEPRLAKGVSLEVAWNGPVPKPAWNWWNPRGNELVVPWRSTPSMIDLNGDRLMDLVTLDIEGYLALYERHRRPDGKLELLPPRRVFWSEGASEFNSAGVPTGAGKSTSGLLRMNSGTAGKSGRRTFCWVDWDGDGKLDLIVNSQPNANLFLGQGRNSRGEWCFEYKGAMHSQVIAGHSTTPTPVDWDKDGVPDLLIGAEDGFFYNLRNPRSK